MKNIRILATACFVLFAGNANASTCYIKEYADLGAGTGGIIAQIPQEPALINQTPVTFTATHGESAAFGTDTRYIEIFCDAQASYLVGAAPVAVNTLLPVPASTSKYVGVRANHKISFVANP